MVFATLSHLAEPGSAKYISLALSLTLMVGVLQLAMGLARLGRLVNFISHTVVIGFTAGAAVLIICGVLSHGFARAFCAVCGHDFLIAFSCYLQRETICSCQLVSDRKLWEYSAVWGLMK